MIVCSIHTVKCELCDNGGGGQFPPPSTHISYLVTYELFETLTMFPLQALNPTTMFAYSTYGNIYFKSIQSY